MIGHFLLYAQNYNGTVAFDCPGVPSSKFQFDLDRRVIAQVMEDPNFESIPLFTRLESLRLRYYQSVDVTKIHQYYGDTLKSRGWNALVASQRELKEKKGRLHLYVLMDSDITLGIFVISESKDGVYLINIVGEIPSKQVSELLRNLNHLGIEIPELMSVNELTPAPKTGGQPSPLTEKNGRIKQTQLYKTGADLRVRSPLAWTYQGKPIYILKRRGTQEELAKMRNGLEGGSGDIEKAVPIIDKLLHPKRITLRIEKEGTERTAVLTVVRPAFRLESLTISKSGTVRKQRETFATGITEEAFPATRFRIAGAPIHEIRIRGNRKVQETEIRKTLGNASEDIEEALKTLFQVMPYFNEVNLEIAEENTKRVATITVDEKLLSSDVYLSLNPPLRFSFNRVIGWKIDTGFAIGLRKQVGPLWVWNVADPVEEQASKLFGKVGYAFGNPRIHYRLGGAANWGKPYVWHLGLTTQIHRGAVAIGSEIFPGYNNGLSTLYRVFGGHDFANYYLRNGVEVAFRWFPVMPTHAFNFRVVAESHESLQKRTDWNITNWRSNRKTRGNPPVTVGQMRSITFQYDFKTRKNRLGWHNTLLIEHSNAAFGSDFDFTRLHLHLRYAFPLGNNRIRTRLLFGFANTVLPIQRQFVISGPGGLRGYPLFAAANDVEKAATGNWYRYSDYAFTGDSGFLLNLEYYYRLSNVLDMDFFKNVFVVGFFDEGQVWGASNKNTRFDPEGNVGIGLQLGENNAIFRINFATPIRSNSPGLRRLSIGQSAVITAVWYQSF